MLRRCPRQQRGDYALDVADARALGQGLISEGYGEEDYMAESSWRETIGAGSPILPIEPGEAQKWQLNAGIHPGRVVVIGGSIVV